MSADIAARLGATALDLLVERIAAAPALALALTALSGLPVGSLSAPHLGLLVYALSPLSRLTTQVQGEEWGREGWSDAQHSHFNSFSSAPASLEQRQRQGLGLLGGVRVELVVKLWPLVPARDHLACLLLLDALLTPLEAAVLRCRAGWAAVPASTLIAATFNSSPH